MYLMQESTDGRKSFFLSLIINAIFGLVIYGMISFVQLQYFDNFWASWVVFVSGLTIAYIVWSRVDPYKGKWTINGWITRGIGSAIFLVLAFAIGF